MTSDRDNDPEIPTATSHNSSSGGSGSMPTEANGPQHLDTAPMLNPESVGRHKLRQTDAAPNDLRHTRISGAWAAVAVAVVFGVALIDFIVENTRSVRIDFFSANGRMPVAVALLAAALSGAAVVLAVGICRTAQLRLTIRRRRRRTGSEPIATTSENEQTNSSLGR